MKYFLLSIFTLTFASFALQSCIGDDYIDDRVDPILRIENPLQSIANDTMLQLNYIFTNNIGLPEAIETTWSSTDNSVASVTDDGIISSWKEGTTTIFLEAEYENTVLSDEFTVEVKETTVIEPMVTSRTGEVKASSFYLLEGNFELAEQENQTLLLTFDNSYQADQGLPGLYIYLSNNPNSINGALEIGPVSVFSGQHAYTISEADLFQYSHVLYFCKPFNVKVGDGQLSE